MRIALDARALLGRPRHHEGVVAAPLFRELSNIRPDWRIDACHDDRSINPDGATGSPLTPRFIAPLTSRFDAWSSFQLPLAAWRDGADVLLCTGLRCPMLRPCPVIGFIDHLNPLEAPRGLTVAAIARFDQRIRRVCRKASRVVLPTNHLRNKLVSEFAAPPQRIAVVPRGPDESIDRVTPAQRHEVLQRYDLSRPFVLHYGPDEPRRNTRKLIEAWAVCDKKVRQKMQLAIIGMSEETGDDLVNVVNRLGLAQSIRLYRGLASPGDLPALLSAADIAALPYAAAGFPNQVLEAWATRATVLTSDCGGIAEVAGDAAMLVDPGDAGAIARGLGRLVKDARNRRELAERGEQRLTQFTWRAAAERLAEVIEEVVGVKTLRRGDTTNEELRKAA